MTPEQRRQIRAYIAARTFTVPALRWLSEALDALDAAESRIADLEHGATVAEQGAGVTPSRLTLGSAAVLSVTEAARLLPWRDTDARAWLRDRGLVRAVPGKAPVVVWGDVVAEIHRASDEPAPVTRSAVALPRAGLRR